MSNSWGTELSLSKQTASGTRQKMWRLSGVHGKKWNKALIHLPAADEMFEVCWGIYLGLEAIKDQ